MKKVIPLSLMCLILLGIGQVRAQTADQPIGFKLNFGTAVYRGDLGNNLTEFAHNGNLAYGAGLSYYISDHFGVALDANFFELKNSNGPNDAVFSKRDTYMNTSDFNLALMLRIKPFITRLNPYIAVGLGGNFLHDNADIRNQSAESNFMFTFPFGVGVNYEISPRFSLNAQMIYNLGFSDDLLDNHPLSADKTIDGNARPDIDGKSHDDFMLTTVGIVFNFGGGKNTEESMEQKMLEQSMKNLKAAQNASDQSADNLRQAHQLNEKTLAAIDSLKLNRHKKNELKSEFVHIVNNIQFAFDKSDILSTSKTELNSLADIMNHYDGLHVNLAGHADKRGSKQYNKELSQRRVQSVKEYLVNHGVNSSRITTNSYGKTQPLLGKSSDVQTTYAQNRAVQLTLSYHNPESK